MKRAPLTPVRLTDIPVERRLIAARVAMKNAVDANERTDILTAALFPSSKLYWVKSGEPLQAAA